MRVGRWHGSGDSLSWPSSCKFAVRVVESTQAKTEEEARTWVKLCCVARKWAENNKRVRMGLMPLSDAASRIVGVRKIIKRSLTPRCTTCGIDTFEVLSLTLLTLAMQKSSFCAALSLLPPLTGIALTNPSSTSSISSSTTTTSSSLHPSLVFHILSLCVSWARCLSDFVDRWQHRLLTEAYDTWIELLDAKHGKNKKTVLPDLFKVSKLAWWRDVKSSSAPCEKNELTY